MAPVEPVTGMHMEKLCKEELSEISAELAYNYSISTGLINFGRRYM